MDKMYTEKEKTKEKVEVPKIEGAVGIRATLNNMGFSDRSIGYDDETGTVTLNGQMLIKPSYLDNEKGVSYASAADIQKSVVDYYKDSKNPVVRVSDAYSAAAGRYGLSGNGLSYGNGTVSVGGKPLDILYIDDSGKAWARESDVYDLVSAYANEVGAEAPNSLYERYADEYLEEINQSINELRNRKEFSYDPNEDPVYLAFKNKYTLEGNRASRDTMANYSALTGGYANSAAVTAGAMANQYYAQQLSNKIPELAQQAYQRYYDDYMADVSILDKMLDTYNKAYGNAVSANEQTRKNSAYTADSIIARDDAAYEREAEEFKRYWEDKLNNQKIEDSARDSYWTDILNSQKVTEGDLRQKGYMLSNEEQSIYLEFYRKLLEGEIEGLNLSNKKTQAELYSKYGI